MKILILTYGTRGDVQPFIALARALDAAGHHTVLAIPTAFASLAKPYGVRVFPTDNGDMPLLQRPDVRAAMETGFDSVQRIRQITAVTRRSLMVPLLRDMAAAAAEGADLVVHPPSNPAHHLAELLGVPSVFVGLQPVWVPTRQFANPSLNAIPWLPPLPQVLNRATYAMRWKPFPGLASSWRRHLLGLPRRRGQHNMLRQADGRPTTVLHAFSRHLLPAPTDYPHWVHTIGSWHLPAAPDWTPPQRLTDFLAAGDPPVSIGFSSMVGADPHRTGCIVIEATRQAGVRAVLLTGWGGIQADQLGDDVLLLDQVPFDWLFPRMAAIVHHGGSGTTAEALASGRPQVVCPFLLTEDQLFWAHRLHAVGVAGAPIPQSKLTVDGLAAAIRGALTDRAMIARAQQLGEQVRSENGLARAVEILETLA